MMRNPAQLRVLHTKLFIMLLAAFKVGDYTLIGEGNRLFMVCDREVCRRGLARKRSMEMLGRGKHTAAYAGWLRRRNRMIRSNVDECVQEYTRLLKEVFPKWPPEE